MLKSFFSQNRLLVRRPMKLIVICVVIASKVYSAVGIVNQPITTALSAVEGADSLEPVLSVVTFNCTSSSPLWFIAGGSDRPTDRVVPDSIHCTAQCCCLVVHGPMNQPWSTHLRTEWAGQGCLHLPGHYSRM